MDMDTIWTLIGVASFRTPVPYFLTLTVFFFWWIHLDCNFFSPTQHANKMLIAILKWGSKTPHSLASRKTSSVRMWFSNGFLIPYTKVTFLVVIDGEKYGNKCEACFEKHDFVLRKWSYQIFHITSMKTFCWTAHIFTFFWLKLDNKFNLFIFLHKPVK